MSGARSLEELEDELTGLAAHINAVDFRFLELIGEFDSRKGWAGWGMRSCAQWLSWKCGVGPVAARERVRVAHALRELPSVAEAMRRGRISYSKVRAITRVATAETEGFLLSVAENGTAHHVEQVVRQYRACERREELQRDRERNDSRRVTHYWDEDGSLVLGVRLGPEQGARVLEALSAAGEALREEQYAREGVSAEASAESWGQRQADALVRCAEAFLAGDGGTLAPGERHQVQVRVDAEVLVDSESGGAGECALEDGPHVPPETARRMTCDGSLVGIVTDGEGSVLDVGRRTRAIPPAMRRALQRRDGGCRFPGCTCTRHVDGHHIEHWSRGGETKLSNLVLLCRHHHRAVHELGFSVWREGGEIWFARPDGTPIAEAPGLPAPRAPRLDVAITPRTAIPGWMGEKLDLTYCLTALFQRRDRAASGEGAGVSAEALH